MSAGYRCFVAVGLPDDLREEIGAFLEREAVRVGGVRWVAREQLHLTLKFLGDTPPERVPEIGRALDAALAGVSPCTLELRGAGAFPSASRPRVVWIGAGAGAAELGALAAAVERCCSALGFPAEERAFAAHLTVGRVKAPPRDPAALPRLLAAVRERVWGRFLVPAVHLMRSELFPAGPIYSILHETRLAGGPAQTEGART